MLVARWSIDARFGYKQNVLDLMQRWMSEVAPKIGLTRDKTRLLTGSIGTLEATIQTEHLIDNLAELEAVWAKLAALDEHKKWGKDLEPFVVSGTSRWEILRVL